MGAGKGQQKRISSESSTTIPLEKQSSWQSRRERKRQEKIDSHLSIALRVANALRVNRGQEPLDDLEPSMPDPQEPGIIVRNPLLEKAWGAKVRNMGGEDLYWYALFEDESDALVAYKELKNCGIKVSVPQFSPRSRPNFTPGWTISPLSTVWRGGIARDLAEAYQGRKLSSRYYSDASELEERRRSVFN